MIDKAHELSQVANKQIEIAQEYSAARNKAGVAEYQLKLILASKLSELRVGRKNLGIEMALLMLMETDQVARGLYEEWMASEAKYKGLEKILDSYSSKLITEQALMKRFSQGEMLGV